MRATLERAHSRWLARPRWPLLTVAVAAFAASPAAHACGQREAVVAACSDLAAGARIVETAEGPVLVATATTSVPTAPRADRALAESAAVAVIEARAEAALFLAGEYERAASSGSTARQQWVRTLSRSMAQTKLSSGERLALRASGGSVRALVAWGLSEASSESAEPGALGMIADAALADPDAPACEVRWVRDASGRDRLLVLVSIYPDLHAGPCTSGEEGKPACGCRLCREKVLESKLAKTVADWGEGGDVSVVRTLRRESSKAADGAEAARVTATKSRTSATTTDLNTGLPAAYFARSAFEYRHGDRRSVGAALVPIEATRMETDAPGNGDAR